MIDYREVTRKDGKTLVFCNFEELLMDAFEVKSIEEVKQHLLGKEYIIHCPFCKAEGHTKHKLYISEDLTKGFCFVCNRIYININETLNLTVLSPKAADQYSMSKPWDIVPLDDEDWTLDMYEYEFDDYSEIGVKYLEGRHKFMKDLWKPLGFKFWQDNIVMPFYNDNKLFYYQIRFSDPRSKIRYFFPPISKKGVYEITRTGDANRKLILVEGVFDAIACLLMAPDYTPIALLGHSINDYQIGFLRKHVPTEILVYQDETWMSENIKKKLGTTIDYCPINIIPSNGEDPEECLKRRIATNRKIDWITSKNNNIKFHVKTKFG